MKQKLVYICQSCGAASPRWVGKCPTCGEWNTYVEEVSIAKKENATSKKIATKITTMAEISTEREYRIKTGINEMDRVLGGGVVPGSLVLIGGDPGIGKSTLMLQLCEKISNNNPLYITGEESLQQIKYRAMRLPNSNDSLMLLAETNAEIINSAITNSSSSVIIVDSIQSIYTERIDSTPGSIGQVKECAMMLMQIAKRTGKAIFIIGHITKEGSIAGPKILEHLVDTVIQFEGEKHYTYRILRCLKNRFGSTNEIGVFEMTDKGLLEVDNPSEVFLSGRNADESGVAIVGTMEGERPILLEVQALVTATNYGVPQRSPNGFELRRLQMLLAVLEKRVGLRFSANDVFVNVAGGIYLNDSSCDFGIAAALVSSLRDVPIDIKTVYIGEIGLTGEVRAVTNIEQRLAEVEKLGFERAFVPATGLSKIRKNFGIKIVPVDKIATGIADLLC